VRFAYPGYKSTVTPRNSAALHRTKLPSLARILRGL
jgi:hypothetical protein